MENPCFYFYSAVLQIINDFEFYYMPTTPIANMCSILQRNSFQDGPNEADDSLSRCKPEAPPQEGPREGRLAILKGIALEIFIWSNIEQI